MRPWATFPCSWPPRVLGWGLGCEILKLLQTEWASISIRGPSPGSSRRLCGEAIHELPSSEGGEDTLWSSYLANEEIVSKGLALNLGGLYGGCHLLPPSLSPGTWSACRERQQNPRAWEQMCEPAKPAPGCRSGCEPLLSHFCLLTPSSDAILQSRRNPIP